MLCYSCKTKITITDKIGFRDDCPQCRADLHTCFNCYFYDVRAYNECRENSAERVVDKQKANYCEYFVPSGGALNTAPVQDTASEAKKKLADLFGKKT